MKNNVDRQGYRLAVKDAQVYLSLFYLLLVGVGMAFTYARYKSFGINIFQYADVFDFLIAPFDDLRIVVFTALSAIVPAAIVALDVYLKRSRPRLYSKFSFGWDKKPWFETYRVISFGTLFILYILVSARHYGEYVSARIKQQPPVSVRFVDNEVERGLQIGKTKETIFLLQGKTVKAIPVNSLVKEIQVRR